MTDPEFSQAPPQLFVMLQVTSSMKPDSNIKKCLESGSARLASDLGSLIFDDVMIKIMMGHSYLGLLGTVRAGHCSLIPRLQFGKKSVWV